MPEQLPHVVFILKLLDEPRVLLVSRDDVLQGVLPRRLRIANGVDRAERAFPDPAEDVIAEQAPGQRR
jgi:hypothetical protein